MPVAIKRIYDDTAPSDGFRVLVDRLWPRGVSKQAAAIDEWAKDAAPSDALRRAFHGGDLDFAAFSEEYQKELASGGAQQLIERVASGEAVTLVYAAKNTEQNHAVVLAAFIDRAAGR